MGGSGSDSGSAARAEDKWTRVDALAALRQLWSYWGPWPPVLEFCVVHISSGGPPAVSSGPPTAAGVVQQTALACLTAFAGVSCLVPGPCQV